MNLTTQFLPGVRAIRAEFELSDIYLEILSTGKHEKVRL